MRIAQVAPLFESVPPRLYGGTERVISYLTEELVRLGHEVTLFASGDSETNAKLVPVCPRALWRDESCRETLPHHVRLMDLVFQDASRFDIIHFHCDYLHFPLLRRHPCPSVTTLHGRLHVPDLQPLFAEFAEVPLVSISHDQQIWTGMFEAGRYFDLHRMPELFCGFPQAPGEGPTLYPVACAPQSWSAASVFLLFQACLGLEINGPEAQIYFIRPHLPASLDELRIHNLEVAGATVDLLLVRHEQDVGVNVLRRDGDVQLLVVK